MTKAKETILKQLSIIFDQLEAEFEDQVTFHDVVTYLYRHHKDSTMRVEDNATVKMLLDYILLSEDK